MDKGGYCGFHCMTSLGTCRLAVCGYNASIHGSDHLHCCLLILWQQRNMASMATKGVQVQTSFAVGALLQSLVWRQRNAGPFAWEWHPKRPKPFCNWVNHCGRYLCLMTHVVILQWVLHCFIISILYCSYIAHAFVSLDTATVQPQKPCLWHTPSFDLTCRPPDLTPMSWSSCTTWSTALTVQPELKSVLHQATSLSALLPTTSWMKTTLVIYAQSNPCS